MLSSRRTLVTLRRMPNQTHLCSMAAVLAPISGFNSYATSQRSEKKKDIETGVAKAWLLKDLRKTCATYYDQHVPESSVEIMGHSVGGITYRHYAHRTPLAFKAITTLPQPSAFLALVRGFENQCPCCRRPFR